MRKSKNKHDDQKRKTKFRRIEWLLAGIALILGLVSVGQLYGIFSGYAGGTALYGELESYVTIPEDGDDASVVREEAPKPEGGAQQEDGAQAESAEQSSETEAVVYYGSCPQVDFEALKSRNSDIVGWIYGPDTAIHYPVVQGTDNAFYLTHMFDGTENSSGSIFLDCLNAADFSDTNSILYGHHMKNNSMFASLVNYGEQSYYDAHPVMWLVTPEKSYKVEIFAGFVTDADSDIWYLSFDSTDSYENWLDQVQRLSYFKSGVVPTAEDKILSMITCSYAYTDARFAVLGVLREV